MRKIVVMAGYVPCVSIGRTVEQEMSVVGFPACHLGRVSNPQRKASTAIWICEYPYRTMRAAGPSAECGDCPVWQAMMRRRGPNAANDTAKVQLLEAMAAS